MPLVAALLLFPADGVFAATPVLFGVEPRLVDFAFFADFFDGFLAVFFAAAVFFGAFLAVFLAFLAARLVFLARFFSAEALATAARRGLRTFFALRFLTVFFLGAATTNSFYCSNQIVGNDRQRSA